MKKDLRTGDILTRAILNIAAIIAVCAIFAIKAMENQLAAHAAPLGLDAKPLAAQSARQPGLTQPVAPMGSNAHVHSAGPAKL